MTFTNIWFIIRVDQWSFISVFMNKNRQDIWKRFDKKQQKIFLIRVHYSLSEFLVYIDFVSKCLNDYRVLTIFYSRWPKSCESQQEVQSSWLGQGPPPHQTELRPPQAARQEPRQEDQTQDQVNYRKVDWLCLPNSPGSVLRDMWCED